MIQRWCWRVRRTNRTIGTSVPDFLDQRGKIQFGYDRVAISIPGGEQSGPQGAQIDRLGPCQIDGVGLSTGLLHMTDKTLL